LNAFHCGLKFPAGAKGKNPMEPVTTTIGAVKIGIELLKSLRGMAREFKSADFNEKLMDLQNVLLDLQGRLVELEAEKDALKRRVQEGDNLKDRKQRMRFEETVWWEYNDAGARDGPFCPNCYDENKIMRLNAGINKGYYSCVHHKTTFRTSEVEGEQIPPPIWTGRHDRG
jgi:hypothetical protein